MYIQQAIQQAVGITVFGSSLMRAEPDLASIQLSVTRLEEEPGNAFRATREAVRSVKQALHQLRVPERDIELSRIGMQSAVDHRTDRLLGYEAETTIRILVRDLNTVEPLLIAVVDAGAHRIETVRFQTSQLKALRKQGRAAAVVSARSKAKVYADAAGVRLGSAIHIEDVNPDSLRRGHSPDIDLTSHDEGTEPNELKPGSITLSAAVMVTFAVVDGSDANKETT